MIKLSFSHIKSKNVFNIFIKHFSYYYHFKNQVIFSKIPIDVKNMNKKWGSFLRINIKKQNVFFDVDTFSACRVFYFKRNSEWFFSDSWNLINSYAPNIRNCDKAIKFFCKHNYFLFDDTINKKIKKIPSDVYLIASNRTKNIYLEKKIKEIKLNQNSYIKKIYKEILRNLFLATKLTIKNKKLKLLSSGGYDSLLIVYALVSLKIPFEVHCVVSGWVKKNDKKKISDLGSFCATNNIKFYSYVINNVDKEKLYKFHDMDPNIAHTFLLFDEIYKHFDKNDVCIVGQGVDSLLSFGPSNNRPISFLARQTIFTKSNIFLFMITKLVNIYFKTKLVRPKDKLEKMISFLNHTNYFCLLNTQEQEINDYCETVIKKLPFKKIDNLKLKKIGFLAGADNSVFNILDKIYNTNTIFPFLDDTICRMVKGSNNKILEQILGKYLIKFILKIFKDRKNITNSGLDLYKMRTGRDKVFKNI